VIRESCGLVDFKDVAEEARRSSRSRIPNRKDQDAGRQTSISAGSPEAARRLLAMSQPIGGTSSKRFAQARHYGLHETGALSIRCYYRPDEHSPTETWPAMIAAVTDLSGNHRRASHLARSRRLGSDSAERRSRRRGVRWAISSATPSASAWAAR
jgi:hypothetical protein